ncbi:hypothetical protein Cme02nite_50190 [Catellatospora methionotrophica]|uniref:Uncharacterized protein n=1 Tax=Catellatospora methionotrophica TaxID=121620 RepID=A0A8J3LCP8_9ACTN|nr:hypothetical protein Cme02nite_50190 [Catellatospora methionotrophica]
MYHVFSGPVSGNVWETYWGGPHTKTNYIVSSSGAPVTALDFEITR